MNETATADQSSIDLGDECDVLVVLHARRCAQAVAGSRERCPSRPVIVALTGTDLYVDLPDDPAARTSVETADRLVVLQDAAIDSLTAMDPALGQKAHVIYQSLGPPFPTRRPPRDRFSILVLAHLRDVKDPLLAARAVRSLTDSSVVEVVHAGHAHDDRWRRLALEEQAQNARYRWLGELERSDALTLLSESSVLACTSTVEGGANVVTEAIALGVPVIGTAIDGTTGLLGQDYPGLVPVGDEAALTELISRLESDDELVQDLTERVASRSWMVEPATERAAWAGVLSSLT